MPARPRRRAVGPPGARPLEDEPRAAEPTGGAWPAQDGTAQDGTAQDGTAQDEVAQRDDERLRAERPPHHDRGV